MMVTNTQKYVLRHGLAGGANYDPKSNRWVPYTSDNDGLWTSLYASG